ncbi:MAG: hypothetical protein AUF65_02230 [Chloroflexi bacterium 13_1_20CM_50_12]|nr:MAG: hypothetical protein AUF65_02230 [Chloroflexi bacterium 13_1_20CM_50_12]
MYTSPNEAISWFDGSLQCLLYFSTQQEFKEYLINGTLPASWSPGACEAIIQQHEAMRQLEDKVLGTGKGIV